MDSRQSIARATAVLNLICCASEIWVCLRLLSLAISHKLREFLRAHIDIFAEATASLIILAAAFDLAHWMTIGELHPCTVAFLGCLTLASRRVRVAS